jgi:hypothetical protein
MKRTPCPIVGTKSLSILRLVLFASLLQFPLVTTGSQKSEVSRVLAHPEVKTLPSKEKRWALIVGIDDIGKKFHLSRVRSTMQEP